MFKLIGWTPIKWRKRIVFEWRRGVSNECFPRCVNSQLCTNVDREIPIVSRLAIIILQLWVE